MTGLVAVREGRLRAAFLFWGFAKPAPKPTLAP